VLDGGGSTAGAADMELSAVLSISSSNGCSSAHARKTIPLEKSAEAGHGEDNALRMNGRQTE
jgi:hypothetical protein